MSRGDIVFAPPIIPDGDLSVDEANDAIETQAIQLLAVLGEMKDAEMRERLLFLALSSNFMSGRVAGFMAATKKQQS